MAVIYIAFTSFLDDMKNYHPKNMAMMQGIEKSFVPIFVQITFLHTHRMPIVRFKVLDIPVHQGFVAFQDQQVFGSFPLLIKIRKHPIIAAEIHAG